MREDEARVTGAASENLFLKQKPNIHLQTDSTGVARAAEVGYICVASRVHPQSVLSAP